MDERIADTIGKAHQADRHCDELRTELHTPKAPTATEAMSRESDRLTDLAYSTHMSKCHDSDGGSRSSWSKECRCPSLCDVLFGHLSWARKTSLTRPP